MASFKGGLKKKKISKKFQKEGSRRIQISFFWFFCQKRGGRSHPIQKDFIRKKWEFFGIFRQKGGEGSGPIQNFLNRKNLGIQIDRVTLNSSVLSFITTVKKMSNYFSAQARSQKVKVVWWGTDLKTTGHRGGQVPQSDMVVLVIE